MESTIRRNVRPSDLDRRTGRENSNIQLLATYPPFSHTVEVCCDIDDTQARKTLLHATTFSKIFERIFLSTMMAVRSVQDAIPDHQFGRRSHHGTPEQAHRVTQHVLGAFENKRLTRWLAV